MSISAWVHNMIAEQIDLQKKNNNFCQYGTPPKELLKGLF